MTGVLFFCCDERRRAQVRGGGSDLTGIDFLEHSDRTGLALDPNVHIQESKVASCDIQPGRRPTGACTR